MPPRWLAASTLLILCACGSTGVADQTAPATTSPAAAEVPSGPFPVVEVDGSVVHDEDLLPLDDRSRQLISSFPADPHPADQTECSGITDGNIGDITGWDEGSVSWRCSHGWLTAIADDCGECEGVSVFRRVSGTWEYATTCHNYNLSDFCRESGPPQEVMCVLWSNDRVLGALSRTGCDASELDITDAVTKTCGYWSEWDPEGSIPFGNCVYGWRVKTFQERLSALGYVTGTDGYFGAQSALATLRYQKDNGLKLTASLDETVYRSVTGN